MKTVKEIKTHLEECPLENLEEVLLQYEKDERKGVQKLLESFRKKQDAHRKELERLETLLFYERTCYKKGYELVAGVDEVGRGPLAGPVVAAAVILPPNCKIEGINDSKKLSAKKREMLAEEIKEKAIAYGIGAVSPERIDEINILQATYEAMGQALDALEPKPQYILADAVTIPKIDIPQEGIVKGDAKSISIGAASIVAKVTRDHMMEEMAGVYPNYDFASNKGYGSQKHLAGIARWGICPIHRRTFVKNFLQETQQENRATGNQGEALAVREMRKMGYRILEQNYRTAYGEIDIIAEKDGILVFAEVKMRKSDTYGKPAEAVDRRKQKHIIETAQAYLAEKEVTEKDCRFDVAEVLEQKGKRYFRYTENAFWMEAGE